MSVSYPKRFPSGMLDDSAVCPPALVPVDEYYEGTMSFYINPEEAKKKKTTKIAELNELCSCHNLVKQFLPSGCFEL